MKKQNSFRKFAYFCVILLLVLVMIVSGLRILESTFFYDKALAGEQIATKTVSKDGVKYYPRKDVTVVMVLGIDQMGPVQAVDPEENEGNADMVALLVFDEASEECTVLCINRDTMVNVPVLNDAGKAVGSVYAQLTLAHLYGTGMEDSCENTRTAVSNFLYGINIDYYVAMNMDAIAIANDAVGGVTVTVTDDFSQLDPDITMGEFTLQGKQAITFVRSRKNLGDQLSVSRVERHKEYVSSFLEALRQKLGDSDTFILSMYEELSPYIVTDCSAKVLSSLMQRYRDYPVREIVSPEGENVQGEQYYEFYADEEKLDELILRLFYAPK